MKHSLLETNPEPGKKESLLTRCANVFSRWSQKYVPDAFVIAVLLTLFTFIIALLMNPSNPYKIVKSWGDGFWTYLTFTMQMVLLMVTGMTLASVPFINRGLQSVAKLADTPQKAYTMTFLISAIAYYINWGLAVVVGAIIAKEVAKKNPNAHFPLLVAAAYAPTALYSAGLSSSIGLTIATKDHFLVDMIGIIPTSQTIFSYSTLIIFFILFITMPIIIVLMAPKSGIISYKAIETDTNSFVKPPQKNLTPAEKLEWTPVLGILLGGIGTLYCVYEFMNSHSLDLNIINLFFLSLGLLLHGSLGNFAQGFKESAQSISPIILQFPFYAGIIAVLGSSGLGSSIIQWMASIASKDTFDIFTYWSAGLVNLLAPSGGGQWALQGPLQVPAGLKLGVDPATIAMAVGWGDAWTNLIQPFWALPLLGVLGLKIKDIMGYCFILCIWVGIVTSILMLFLY
ncbi:MULTISPECIES: short-chain fatty acid transporter [Bacillus]|uniref:Short-chain fatty acid transporter n=1 Tax=Bacillus wiedmannii TaxID=1890302 RepID=A0A2B5IVF9_9BACI|nr:MULTISPECIES: TIGR00366 family protein [Bacillus]MDF9662690.1 TIGR00366 family protein [Bacillus wiedmannii]MDI6506452.1 TIGR00366 family protein [Bacillus wiedmannii]MDI6513030.1 TIGR00366 family protein [Bacillus wiedmannii]PFZ29173.1 short-chain fatty acid transporter [Bacillus wiedmannii]PGC21270.1 short-chain fatty acid transporter [Bacillus wiedmannii]